MKEGNTCPWRRETPVPGRGKGESQLFVLSKIAKIVERRNEDGNVLRIKYTRNAYTDGFCNVQGERAW